MPYLQLDTPFEYTTEQKQHLAKRLGEIYSTTMQSNINRLTVAIRELGAGNVWRCGEDAPRPAALLMCDIRRGRPAALRAELARKLIDSCIEILGLREDNLNLEFTQHDGDEMYHTLYGGLSDDWSPGKVDSIDQLVSR
jgi:phenylpyruvate tautomerase PptA (4-oxalocrotonate tautomerase family)